jgi:aspartate racemase
MNKKAIGILGGMGPEASSYLYKTLIDLSIKYFGAKNNDDFPEIILYSVPVPDFISNYKNRSKALQMLKKRVIDFNKINLSCLSIACNTAHLLIDDLGRISSNEFTSIIDEVSLAVVKDKRKIVGIMGTPSTVKSGLYQSKLAKYNIQSVVPTSKELRILEKVIRNILKGKILKTDNERLFKVASSLKKRGAEGIILGCTELPLVFSEKYSLPVYNSVKILALALLQKYYKQNTI